MNVTGEAISTRTSGISNGATAVAKVASYHCAGLN